jgi:hypothetical protein
MGGSVCSTYGVRVLQPKGRYGKAGADARCGTLFFVSCRREGGGGTSSVLQPRLRHRWVWRAPTARRARDMTCLDTCHRSRRRCGRRALEERGGAAGAWASHAHGADARRLEAHMQQLVSDLLGRGIGGRMAAGRGAETGEDRALQRGGGNEGAATKRSLARARPPAASPRSPSPTPQDAQAKLSNPANPASAHAKQCPLPECPTPCCRGGPASRAWLRRGLQS